MNVTVDIGDFFGDDCFIHKTNEHEVDLSHPINERPIYVTEERKCQDEVFWAFCWQKCTEAGNLNAKVARFDCQKLLTKENNFLPGLSHDICSLEKYHKPRWVNCYCHPHGLHTKWIVAISAFALITVLAKFVGYFQYKYLKTQPRGVSQKLSKSTKKSPDDTVRLLL